MSIKPIKHLVISGGGPTGLLTYGVAAQLAKKDFWHLKDIKSIYGCSIGAYMGVVFSLGYDWEWLDDYFIKRPWEKLAATSTLRFIDMYEKKSVLNEDFLQEAIRPLLRAKELPEEVTLAEFYAFNNIDIHMYATNINSDRLTKIDISHTTHPQLSLIKALQITQAVPILFPPILFGEEQCYVDGGLLNNFPLNDCLQQQECQPAEVLAFKNMWKNTKQTVDTASSMFDFFFVLMKKMQASLDTEPEQAEHKVDSIVRCRIDDLASFDKWSEALASEEMRKSIVEKGMAQADQFLLTRKN
jgi:predicted acylesterase/phospholipase RssA